MRYGKQHPLAQSFDPAIYRMDQKTPSVNFDPGKPDPWRIAITAHRAVLEKHWSDLTPQRAWWTECST